MWSLSTAWARFGSCDPRTPGRCRVSCQGLKQKLRQYLRILASLGLLLAVALTFSVVVGALWTVNSDFTPAQEDGVKVWVFAGPIHTDILFPASGPDHEWSELLRPGESTPDFLAIGWGDRKFYLETPTWADVTVGNVVGAFLGLHRTALHVDRWTSMPTQTAQCRQVVLTHAQYLKLCAFVRASFSRDSEGRPMLIPGRGYGHSDDFYEATGCYSLLRTCNCWAGEAMAAAGVKMGRWTPLPQSVLVSLQGQ